MNTPSWAGHAGWDMGNLLTTMSRKGRSSVPVPQHQSTVEESWKKSDTLMRTSSPTWKTWTSATGPESMVTNAGTVPKQLFTMWEAKPAGAGTMNSKPD